MDTRGKVRNKAKIERLIKIKAKLANAVSVAVFGTKRGNAASAAAAAPLPTDLPPSDVPAAVSRDGIIELSCGDNVSPLTANLGHLQRNPESNTPNNNNEDNNKADIAVATINTVTLPVDKIERIRTTHGDEEEGVGISDVNGDGFDVIQDFEIPTNDNNEDKLLNEYDETETCVYYGINNASLLG